MTRLSRLCVPALLVLATAALAATPEPKPAPFPVADLEQQPTTTVLLFHPSPPKLSVEGEAKALLARQFKGLKPVTSSEAMTSAAGAAVLIKKLPPEALDTISERELQYFGRGLDAAQSKQLMGAKQATLLLFRMPRKTRFESLKEATGFAHALAERVGAFLYDTDTRLYFTPASWKQQRLDTWKGQVPFLADHITYHLYPSDKGLRAISLGMVKFGLPDVVVEQVPRALGTPLGHVLNASIQLLAEGSVPDASGNFVVALERLKEGRAREQLLSDLGANAKRQTKLLALRGRPEEGDPDNALLELGFPGPEATLESRQLARVAELIGSQPDKMIQAPTDDAELAQVATKARKRLGELRPVFTKGLAPDASLSIKAGFPTDDGGTEWMWFELVSWQGETLRGTLLNEPQEVSSLKLGAAVKVRLDQVGDYLYRTGDGKEEGNESSRILERRESE